MTKNPFINAGTAALYIAGIVWFITSLPGPDPEGPIMPMAVLSLLVLSVLFMAYTLLLSPVRLYLDNEKEAAVRLFGQTVAVFACITVALLLILYFFGTQ